jgi:hypothetical protein
MRSFTFGLVLPNEMAGAALERLEMGFGPSANVWVDL